MPSHGICCQVSQIEMGKVVPGPPGPRPKLFFRRDRDEIFFLTGTGIKNDWSRSYLLSDEAFNSVLTHLR